MFYMFEKEFLPRWICIAAMCLTGVLFFSLAIILDIRHSNNFKRGNLPKKKKQSSNSQESISNERTGISVKDEEN
jgi:hypothetical protein